LAEGIDVGSLCVKDLMTTNLVTVNETETLLNTLAIMQTRSVRRIVVVNDEGQLKGLLSVDDAIELIAQAMDSLTRLIKHEITQEYQKRP
jgi:predicted transcriptional regulator